MPALLHAIFEETEPRHITVSVRRVPQAGSAAPIWLVIVKDDAADGVILFRRFLSLDHALGFAAEVFPTLQKSAEA